MWATWNLIEQGMNNHIYNFTRVVFYAVYTSEHFDSKLIKNKRIRIE